MVHSFFAKCGGVDLFSCFLNTFLTPPLWANFYVATQISKVPIEKRFDRKGS